MRHVLLIPRRLAAVTLLCAATLAAAQPPVSGGVYRAPLESEPATLDPALYSDKYAVQVATNLFDGLVAFDQQLNVVPAIARRWKISRDRRTYTFSLRPGVSFHNGRVVTAEDFVYSFSRLLDPELKSPAASFFMDIEGAKAFNKGDSATVTGLRAPDPLTLTIELEEPFTPFLSILAMSNAKVVPREAVDGDFAKNPIGTGPFKFRHWRDAQEIVLDANPGYFAGRPHLDSARFVIYPNINWERIYGDFQAGRLHHATVPRDQYDLLSKHDATRSDFTLVSKPGLNIVYLGMNLSVAPFDDLRVRQAVNYAIDTKSLSKNITKRGSKTIAGILPPGIAGFDPGLEGYDYDPQRARALLAEAGHADGTPAVELWTVSKSGNVRQQIEAISAWLAEIGMATEIRVADSWKDFVQAINGGRAGLYYAAWYADYPDADNFFFPLTHSSSRTNRMRFRDTEIDRLIETARAEADYLTRVDLYRELERRVLQGSPLVSLHVNANSYLFADNVRGIEMTPMGMMIVPLDKVWLSEQPLSRTQQNTLANTR